MKKQYRIKTILATHKSVLAQPPSAASPFHSDLYLQKRHGWLSYEVIPSSKLKEQWEPVIYKHTSQKNHEVYHTNNLNFSMTNIRHKGKPYRYKVVHPVGMTLKQIKHALHDHTIISIDGKYYTNIAGFDGDSVYTEYVGDRSQSKVTFYAKHMEVKVPKGYELMFFDSVQYVNRYKFYLPSFYLNSIRCVESNVKLAIEDCKSGVELPFPITTSLGYQNASCALNRVTEDVALILFNSTHIFVMPNETETFWIHNDGTISKQDSFNGLHFTVRKVVDLDKIKVIPNRYKLDSFDTNADVLFKKTLIQHTSTGAWDKKTWLSADQKLMPVDLALPTTNVIDDVRMATVPIKDVTLPSSVSTFNHAESNTTLVEHSFADAIQAVVVDDVAYYKE